MESPIGLEEFEERVMRETNFFIRKNFTDFEKRSRREMRNKINSIFFRTEKTQRLCESVSSSTKIKGDTVEMLIRSVVRIAFREHRSDLEFLRRQNEKLSHWLKEAQQKIKTCEKNTGKVKETHSKEPMGKERKNGNRKLDKKKARAKNRNKGIKEINLAKKEGDEVNLKNRGYSEMSRDLTFYDIPARYSEEEVVSAIKSLGIIKRISIKKQFKYQTVKAEMYLNAASELDFTKKKMKVDLIIGSESNKKVIQIRWFSGQLSVKAIKERCKWKAYKVIHISYLQDVAKNKYEFEFGKHVRFGKKLVFLAYFKDEKMMKEMIQRSIELEGLDKAWIIHGSKNIQHTPNILPLQQDDTFTQPQDITRQESMDKKVVRLEENREEQVGPLPSEESVVNIVNKYRKNLLEAEEPTVKPTSLKDYTTPEKVVEIVENLREEIKESERLPSNTIDLTEDDEKNTMTEAQKAEAILLSGMSDEEAYNYLQEKIARLEREANEEADRRDQALASKLINEGKTSLQKSLKPISEQEFKEYHTINAECSERLNLNKKASSLEDASVTKEKGKKRLIVEEKEVKVKKENVSNKKKASGLKGGWLK